MVKKMLFRWLLVLVTVCSCLALTVAADEVEYTITLDVRGGNALPAITTVYGAKVTAPSDPTRYGYDFGGWYADEGLTTPYTFTTMPMGGATVYAKWISKDQGRGIEYRINDITFRDPDSYELLDGIPDSDFLAEVSVTNIASTKMDTVLFVSYTDQGQMLGFHYAFANPAVGQSMTFGTAIDNKDGQVGQIKAMVLSSLAGAVPLAEAVDTGEGIDLGALVNDVVFVSKEAIEEAVPVGADTIRLDVTVVRTGEVKNIRAQVDGALEEDFYVCRYVPGERQHTLTVASDEVLAEELELKIVTGFITANQATGENYTKVSGLYLNLETGLDMLGHYVTAYYKEAYKDEKNPGVAYFLIDNAKYVEVAEDIDSNRIKYMAAFGAVVELDDTAVIFSFDGNAEVPESIRYDRSTYTAQAGTYVIDKESGRIIAYIAPVSYTVGQVTRVVTTAGKESIRIGARVYSNTANDDQIVEYDGIAEGDVVVVKTYNDITYLEKAEIVTGKVTRIGTVDGKVVTYIDGKEYINAGKNVDAISGMTATAYPSAEITYDAYIYGDKLLGLIEHAEIVTLNDIIYVVDNYTLSVGDAYGATADYYYAQGVDANGKEVSVLIGVDDLGVQTMGRGFYTFEKSIYKDEAEKGIMVAVAVKTLYEFNSDDDAFFSGAGCTVNREEIKKDDKYLFVDDFRVFLTADTKFILFEENGQGVDELKIATYTGGITKATYNDTISVVGVEDEDGNWIAAIVMIGTNSIRVMPEDYIYVIDGADYTIVEDGFEYNVFFTSTNEFKTIVTDYVCNTGFYGDYFVDEDGVYGLGVAVGGYDCCVREGQVLTGVYGGTAISSEELDLCDATNAVIVDVRSEDAIEDSGIGEIVSLQDIVSVYKAKHQIHFSAIIDADGSEHLITHLFVTGIIPSDNGETPEAPEPDAANLSDAIFVVDTYVTTSNGNYGSDTEYYYAQGIDANGKEVSVLIGVEGCIDTDPNTSETVVTDVIFEGSDVDSDGVNDGLNKFYTFEKVTADKEQAKKGVMKATKAADFAAFSVEGADEKFFAEAVTGTHQTPGQIKKDDKYVWVNEGTRVYLTENTKFFVVKDNATADVLEIATYTGPIAKEVQYDNITAIATVDEYGNYQAEIVVIVTPNIALKSEGYIYVVDGTDYALVNGGYEYTVFFTSTNEFKAIVTDYVCDTGFYGDYFIDEDGIYDLGAAAVNDSYVKNNQRAASVFGTSLSATDIDLVDAGKAVFVDVRDADVLEDSDVAAIESLTDLASALRADYYVYFDALLKDESGEQIISHIFVTDVTELAHDDDTPGDDIPEEPGLADTGIVYLVGAFSTSVTDEYGNKTLTYTARGVDLSGKEVLYPVSKVEDVNGNDTYDEGETYIGMYPAAGVTEGFYTIEDPADAEAKTEGLKVVKPLPAYNNGGMFQVALTTAKSGFYGSGELKTDDTVPTFAKAGTGTKYLFIDGDVNSSTPLTAAVETTVFVALPVGTHMLVSRLPDGASNQAEMIVVRQSITDATHGTSVFVTEEQLEEVSRTGDGYQFTAYNAKTADSMTLVVESMDGLAEGFYSAKADEDGIHTLTPIAVDAKTGSASGILNGNTNDDVLHMNRGYHGSAKGSVIFMAHAGDGAYKQLLYADAKVVDLRSDEEVKASGVARLDSIDQIISMKNSNPALAVVAHVYGYQSSSSTYASVIYVTKALIGPGFGSVVYSEEAPGAYGTVTMRVVDGLGYDIGQSVQVTFDKCDTPNQPGFYTYDVNADGQLTLTFSKPSKNLGLHNLIDAIDENGVVYASDYGSCTCGGCTGTEAFEFTITDSTLIYDKDGSLMTVDELRALAEASFATVNYSCDGAGNALVVFVYDNGLGEFTTDPGVIYVSGGTGFTQGYKAAFKGYYVDGTAAPDVEKDFMVKVTNTINPSTNAPGAGSFYVRDAEGNMTLLTVDSGKVAYHNFFLGYEDGTLTVTTDTESFHTVDEHAGLDCTGEDEAVLVVSGVPDDLPVIGIAGIDTIAELQAWVEANPEKMPPLVSYYMKDGEVTALYGESSGAFEHDLVKNEVFYVGKLPTAGLANNTTAGYNSEAYIVHGAWAGKKFTLNYGGYRTTAATNEKTASTGYFVYGSEANGVVKMRVPAYEFFPRQRVTPIIHNLFEKVEGGILYTSQTNTATGKFYGKLSESHGSSTPANNTCKLYCSHATSEPTSMDVSGRVTVYDLRSAEAKATLPITASLAGLQEAYDNDIAVYINTCADSVVGNPRVIFIVDAEQVEF